MGRRLPRRVWHTVAALVPLPLIALGYVAAVPGNPVAFQIELYFSGEGAAYPQTRTADATHLPFSIPRQAGFLFRAGGKGRGPISISLKRRSPTPASSSSRRA